MSAAPTPTPDERADVVPDPRDRRVLDRRAGGDRRAGREAPPGVERRGGERRGGDRRSDPPEIELYRGSERRINEYPLSPEELEFINAVNAYKQRHGRPFPTWSEVLHIVRALGYEKRADGAGA